MLKNRIHHCRTSGIFMRLAASGLIAGVGLFVCRSACLCVCPSVHPSVGLGVLLCDSFLLLFFVFVFLFTLTYLALCHKQLMPVPV